MGGNPSRTRVHNGHWPGVASTRPAEASADVRRTTLDGRRRGFEPSFIVVLTGGIGSRFLPVTVKWAARLGSALRAVQGGGGARDATWSHGEADRPTPLASDGRLSADG